MSTQIANFEPPDFDPSDLEREPESNSSRSAKMMITIRLDPDVVAWFKSQGPGYQTRMNQALRRAIDRAQTQVPH